MRYNFQEKKFWKDFRLKIAKQLKLNQSELGRFLKLGFLFGVH